MIIDPSQQSTRSIYRLLVSTVLPRPIAWVSTQNRDGVINVAPYSFFQVVGSRPPMVSLSIGQREWNGVRVKKDTLRNIEDSGEFVVNIATVPNLEQINQSSAEYAPDESEAKALELTMIPSQVVATPRVADSPIHFECKLDRVLMLGDEPQVGLVIGEVVRAHVADELWDADTESVDPSRLNPLSRLGGSLFASVGQRYDRPRPGPVAPRSDK